MRAGALKTPIKTAITMIVGLVSCTEGEDGGLLPEGAWPGDPALSGGKTLGPAGGRLTVGPLLLDFPEGALSESVRITVTPLPLTPGPALPAAPRALSATQVEPADLKLKRPVKIGFATPREVAGLAVARVGTVSGERPAWLPLPAQRTSPGLVQAQGLSLGTLGLIPVSCCADERDCLSRCDVGPLRYRCGGPGDSTCCDPFAGAPISAAAPLCMDQ